MSAPWRPDATSPNRDPAVVAMSRVRVFVSTGETERERHLDWLAHLNALHDRHRVRRGSWGEACARLGIPDQSRRVMRVEEPRRDVPQRERQASLVERLEAKAKAA